jgi:hypothetical protein
MLIARFIRVSLSGFTLTAHAAGADRKTASRGPDLRRACNARVSKGIGGLGGAW